MSDRTIRSTSSEKAIAPPLTGGGTRTDPQRSNSATNKKRRLSQLLSQSLALSLARVRNECGDETAIGILDILQDDCFDLSAFKKEFSSIQQCQETTNSLVSSLKK